MPMVVRSMITLQLFLRVSMAVVAVVAALLCSIADCAAQAAPAATFDVASVKPNNGSDGAGSIVVDPGRFTATGVVLTDLIRYAYGFNSLTSRSQVVGGPSWITTARFDIVATSNGEPTLGMLKALLEDRFKVMTHIESRDAAVYALVLDRKDGRLGPSMHPSTSTCEGAGGTLPPTSSSANTRCAVRGRPGSYGGEGTSMAQLARALGNFPAVGRIVIDRTALVGVFDWTLEWTPSFNAGPNRDGTPVANPDADAGTSLFSALREQLCLRLDAQRAAVDVLVIDRAELPTPD
jgi:uncharacterized protein (TIGR03435 family)